MNHKLIGFDRKIHLSWLDATADWAAQGLRAADIRKRLDRLLDGQVAGIGSHSARGRAVASSTSIRGRSTPSRYSPTPRTRAE